jgi:hypothetical protein
MCFQTIFLSEYGIPTLVFSLGDYSSKSVDLHQSLETSRAGSPRLYGNTVTHDFSLL